jgi:hypothetical protein
MILSMMFLNQATVASVAKADAGDASGIFNAARNLVDLLLWRGWLRSRTSGFGTIAAAWKSP